MLVIVILLSRLLILQLIYILYYKRQIKDVGDQLAFVFKNDSLKFIQTQIKPKELSRLIDLCNAMLQQKRELNRDFIQKSEEINTTIVSLSHDIRTPITSLDGYLQLAKGTEEQTVKAKYIELAESRIKQINTLVDELFLYTKLQNPDYSLEIEPLAIVNVLKKSLFSFIDDFAQIEMEPNLKVRESIIEIAANRIGLERVFENIIKNYFVHGVGELHIADEEDEGNIHIHFTNKLKTNSQLDYNKIFTRFYKEDLSRTAQSSGLGLSIVKSLTEKMNGEVKGELKDNLFCITLSFPKV
ncbi:sensor histidine kinase [Oceanobacillus sp. CAU 1775]